MGQKVSPTGLRIGINKDWESKWYAENDFAKYLNNDYKIRKYLNKKFKNAGISQIVVERNPKRCEIFIYAAKPGLIIGQSGVEIEKIKKEVAKLVNEEIQISVVEIKNPDMVAELVAQNIAHNIENRVSFRVAQKKAIRNTMKAGAKGIKTLRADIDYATAEADTTYGKIGVKVWIYKGEILKGKGGNSHVDAKKN